MTSEGNFVQGPARSQAESDKSSSETRQEGQGTLAVAAMLRRGQPQPNEVAALLRQHPRARDEIVRLLNTQVGMLFARTVVALANETHATEPNGKTATGGSTNEPTPPRIPDVARTSPEGDHEVVDWPEPRLLRITASDGLNVRETSSKSGNILGGLTSDEEVEAIGQEGEWFRIHHKGRVAFINAGFAAFIPHAPPTVSEPKDDSPAPNAPKTSAAGAATPSAEHASAPITTAGSQSIPAVSSAPAETHAEAAVATQASSQTSYLAKYTSLGGTNIADLKTSKPEADTLNALRHSDKRFDPVWLATAQKTGLGVVATGAFNTETLRALRKLHPALTAEGILSDRGGALSSLAPGNPFITTEAGGGDADKKAMVGATRADRAAHALGYSDYASFHQTLLPATLLGVALNKGQGSGLAHPHLLSRLAVAESFLRHRHPGASDHDIVKAIGWNGSGNAAYADDEKLNKSHFHTMGLAVDIDVSHNPYVFTGRQDIRKNDDAGAQKSKGQNNWWMDMFEKHMAYAARIYGGEKVSASVLNDWAAKMSTDELYARVAEMSQSFKSYMDLAHKKDPDILLAFTQAGISATDAQAAMPEVKQVPHLFHDFYGRKDATTLTNHSQELLVALRDVAGLSWGGAEMSGNENGDFMHFDCRQDPLGMVLQHFNFP